MMPSELMLKPLELSVVSPTIPPLPLNSDYSKLILGILNSSESTLMDNSLTLHHYITTPLLKTVVVVLGMIDNSSLR